MDKLSYILKNQQKLIICNSIHPSIVVKWLQLEFSALYLRFLIITKNSQLFTIISIHHITIAVVIAVIDS